jgi:hypothetical protein
VSIVVPLGMQQQIEGTLTDLAGTVTMMMDDGDTNHELRNLSTNSKTLQKGSVCSPNEIPHSRDIFIVLLVREH